MCISSLETKIFFEEGRFAKKKNLKKYEYFFIVKDHLKELIGVDITTIPGINENTAVKIISEIGTDINRWPSAKHFCAWIGLCSSTMISEGHVLRGRNRSCTNRAGIFLGLAANTLYRSNTLYGTFLRKMKFHKFLLKQYKRWLTKWREHCIQ